jgi:uncharacterized protein (DUF1499 family)
MRSTLGLIAAILFVIGPGLAWLRVVPGMVGFVMFALGGLVAFFTGVASVVSAVRGRGLTSGGAAALVCAVVFLAAVARGRSAPRINDFTTDLAEPPTFRHALRLPENAGRDMRYPATFAAVQQACCADLHPARLPVPPADAFARAREVAERTPAWMITVADPGSGTIEAIATTRLFGFHDDIAIRVRADGAQGSRVDMRSKSRNGQGDIGTNAARIRAFVEELERGAGRPPP